MTVSVVVNQGNWFMTVSVVVNQGNWFMTVSVMVNQCSLLYDCQCCE